MTNIRRAGIGAVAALVAGCSPGPIAHPGSGGGPMNKPVPLGSDAGSGALESTRRELTGTWDLTALEIAPPGKTDRVPVQASGTLVYDDYGNLMIDAHTSDPAAPVAAREVQMLSFKGRAAIDVVKRELKLMDLTGNANPDEVLSPERRRKFTVAANVLTLSSIDDQGAITAVTTWRRRP